MDNQKKAAAFIPLVFTFFLWGSMQSVIAIYLVGVVRIHPPLLRDKN